RHPLLPYGGQRGPRWVGIAAGARGSAGQGQHRPCGRRLALHPGLRAHGPGRRRGERSGKRHVRPGPGARLLLERRGRGVVQRGQEADLRAAAQRQRPGRPQTTLVVRHEQADAGTGRPGKGAGAGHGRSLRGGHYPGGRRADRGRAHNDHRSPRHQVMDSDHLSTTGPGSAATGATIRAAERPAGSPDLRPQVTLFEVLSMLLQRWRTTAAAPLLTALLVAGVAFLVPPTYTATTTFVPEVRTQS